MVARVVNMDAIGIRLKKLRGSRSQGAMAELCAVSRQAWNQWETGRRLISLSHAETVASATSASLDWLILGKGDPPMG